MSRWLFFADTPLQLYNSYLIASDNLSTGDVSDVVIYNQFRDARRLMSEYGQTGRFNAIYLCKEYVCSNFKKRFLWQMHACLGGSRLDLRSLQGVSYDFFAFACPTPTTLDVLQTLRKANPDVKTVVFEDGTGTYTGNVFRQPFYFDKPPDESLTALPYVQAIQKLLSKLRAKKMLYNPQMLYVKKPQLLQYHSNIPCSKMQVTPRAIEPLKHLFPQGNETCTTKKIILLDVPRTELENTGAALMDQIIQAARSLGRPCLLRPHPRSSFMSDYRESCIDFSGGSWELLCQTSNLDDAILVSLGSSAQLAPYIEADKKPYLVFLYRILYKKDSRNYHLDEQIQNMAQQGYGSDSDRIVAPSTIEDALLAISHFANSTEHK